MNVCMEVYVNVCDAIDFLASLPESIFFLLYEPMQTQSVNNTPWSTS